MFKFKPGHEVQLLQCGAAFFPALIASIDSAQSEVRVETYIFDFEAAGADVAAALVRAAQRSVQVYLMMDGLGTPEVPEQWQRQFDEAGVRWHQFSPLGALGLLKPMHWRRLHRKLCVVDAQQLFCGGINLMDDFRDHNHGVQAFPRFDFAVRVQGPLVLEAHLAMVQFWVRQETAQLLEHRQWSGVRESFVASMRTTRGQRGAPLPDFGATGSVAALVLRDNLRNRARIERAYRKAIGDAKHEIWIANAYFLPGRKLRSALEHAARRGVRVRLLLQGQYEYFMQFHGARPVYGSLLAAGVEIHEYSAGFLHAKVAVVDGRWATVGSSNLDPLSLLLAREANVVVEDRVFAQELCSRLAQAIDTHGVQLVPELYAQRPWSQRSLDYVAYGLMRILLFLTGMHY